MNILPSLDEWKKRWTHSHKSSFFLFYGWYTRLIALRLRDQLPNAMKMVQAEGKGVILYMNQEGRGIGFDEQVQSL